MRMKYSKKNTYALQRYFKHTCILDVLYEIVALKKLFSSRPGMMPPFSVPDYVLPRPKIL